jgi:hypothetical protein
VRLGEVDVVPGLPFCGQMLGFDAAGKVEGVASVADLDSDDDWTRKRLTGAFLIF